MKKTYSLFVILVALTLPSFGQGGLKLTAFGGYTFQDKVYGYYGDLIIGDGGHFGGMLSYEKSDQLSVDLTYSWQGTTFSARDYSGAIAQEESIDGSVNYIMLGASHSPSFSAKVAPYGGMMLGTAILSPKEKYSDEWRFAVGLKLGAIFHASDRVGIVIQSQLMVPVQGVGLAVGCGSGGCGSGVSTSSSATQFGFTGGIEIKLNN